MGMGFHISLNGCGLKTEENLATAKAIPLSHLLLETGTSRTTLIQLVLIAAVDAPWCSMTSAHASNAHLATLDEARRALYFPPAVKPEKFVPGKPVKGRNEPSAIGGVAWVVAQVQGVPFEDVVEASWRNTVSLFGLDEADFQTPESST
jgi:TatD DNase family protein